MQRSRSVRGDPVESSLEMLFRLNSSRRVHTRQAVAAGVAISQPGSLILRKLDASGPLTLGHLAREAAMDPAATGRQVRQLERDGLVRRSRPSGDGRITVVEVTEAGRQVRRRITAVRRRHLDDALSAWSDADRAELGRLLGRLVADLRPLQYRAAPQDESA